MTRLVSEDRTCLTGAMTNTEQFTMKERNPVRRATTLVKAYGPRISLGTGEALSLVTMSNEDIETCLVDIVADLKLFCDARGLDFQTIVATAESHRRAARR